MGKRKVIGVFWNVERFFGLSGGPIARSLGATAANHWNAEAYAAKLRNVVAVLNEIAKSHEIAFVGLCEVETGEIVDDIIRELGWKNMINADGFASSKGLDGNDVALMYSSKYFCKRPQSIQSISLNHRFASRDILYARLKLRKKRGIVGLVVVHWPSRLITEGAILRLAYSHYLGNLLRRHLKFGKEDIIKPNGKIKMPGKRVIRDRWNLPLIVLGDFNDEPFDQSVRIVLRAISDPDSLKKRTNLGEKSLTTARTYMNKPVSLFNPSWDIISNPTVPNGTFYRDGTWRIYDQVMMSRGCLEPDTPLRYIDKSIRVFRQERIEFKGHSVKMCTSGGFPKGYSAKTRNGVSDHFPVFVEMQLS